MEEFDGLKLAYDQGISTHLEGKIIDYQAGSQGFTITDQQPSPGCGSCS